MKYIELKGIDKKASQMALGCMRLNSKNEKDVSYLIHTALDEGCNFFDHADIYGKGECERIFGTVLKAEPSLRDKMIIQTKCGIRQGMYDFSKDHIISSVDKALQRLETGKIDILLLHRPDILMDPTEVAEAFDILYSSGKVCAFGVSNHSPYQTELLQRATKHKLIVNQLQLSLLHATMLSSGANVNINFHDAGVDRDGGIRDWCRLNDVTIQPWSPLQNRFERKYIEEGMSDELLTKISVLSEKYGVSHSAILLSWLLKLPDRMQPIIGTTSHEHLKDAVKAFDAELTREEWYSLYTCAGYNLP